MNPKLKVCGMKAPDNIRELVKLDIDYIGFIFYPGSKRYAGEYLSKEVIDLIPAHIQKTGVFVDRSKEDILKIAHTNKLDVIQLHGGQTPQLCAAIKEKGYTTVKVFGIGQNFNMKVIEPYKNKCNYFLFDTKSKQYGGTGIKFNWEQLSDYDNEVPLFLSGGIAPGDTGILDQLKNLNIHAIDINSKFEAEPGIKNIDLIKSFLINLKS